MTECEEEFKKLMRHYIDEGWPKGTIDKQPISYFVGFEACWVRCFEPLEERNKKLMECAQFYAGSDKWVPRTTARAKKCLEKLND